MIGGFTSQLGKIQAGIEITREQDAVKAAEIEAWADQVTAVWNVLAMDATTFWAWAKLMHRSVELEQCGKSVY
jgi:hypothetical protein